MSELIKNHATATAGRVRIDGVECAFPTKDGARTVLRDLDLEVQHASRKTRIASLLAE